MSPLNTTKSGFSAASTVRWTCRIERSQWAAVLRGAPRGCSAGRLVAAAGALVACNTTTTSHTPPPRR